MKVIGVFDTSDLSGCLPSAASAFSHHFSLFSSFTLSGSWCHFVSTAKDDAFHDSVKSTILSLDATVENAIELVCFAYPIE
jgi:hypothetical protein